MATDDVISTLNLTSTWLKSSAIDSFFYNAFLMLLHPIHVHK